MGACCAALTAASTGVMKAEKKEAPAYSMPVLLALAISG